MPPKKRKGRGKAGKGNKKPKAPVDWSVDPHFNENRAMIYIEHTNECPIFLEKANEFQDYLKKQFPEKLFQMILNGDGKIQPRVGAFEVEFSKTARTEKSLLWSGIDKGPPRREKFPVSYEQLLPDVEKILKKIYITPTDERRPLIDMNDELGEDEPITQMVYDATDGDTSS